MKNLIQIGGGILLLVVLLSKKKEVVSSDQAETAGGLFSETIPIIVPATINASAEKLGVSEANRALSPTLTNYEISDTEKLINALNHSQSVLGTIDNGGSIGDGFVIAKP